ncbi:MAG: TonB-dependent receptor [Psychrobium sp.]|nr:TonB-dependent receptor [Psychrobium sp.]
MTTTSLTLNCALLVFSLPMATFAQATSDPKQIETIVITGTRTAKLLNDSPVLVEVIDGDTIAKLSQGTMATALNYIPGIVVKRSVKDGYNIQMQGFDGDHVLVLVDGQPLISPTGSSTDLDQIPVSNIAQIEVIRGAASVMYGSSAMGGVINIITKKSKESAFKIDYDMSQYQGNAIKNGDVNHTFKLNVAQDIAGWFSQINVLYIDDQGYDYDTTTVSQDAASVAKTLLTLSSNKDFEHINTRVKYQWLDDNKQRDSSKIPGQSEIIFYQTKVKQQQFELNLSSLKGTTAPWQLNGRYVSHQEVSGQSNSIRDTDIELIELNGQKVFQLANLEVVSGAVIHADKLDQTKPVDRITEIDNESRESAELFVQGNWAKDSYQILAGMRSQYDSDFGWHNALRLSMMKKSTLGQSTLQWRAGFGQSYRVPNLKERFYSFDHSALGYMVLGNKALTPETADSINASLTFNTSIFDKRVDLRSDISVHYTKTDNLIYSVIDTQKSAQSGLSIYQYQNISQATMRGFDISTELTFNQWQMQLNYSYLTSEDQQQQRLLSRPRQQIKFNVNVDIAYDIELIVYAVYQTDEAIADSYQGVENNEFTTVNAIFNQAINDNLSWRLSIDNLFDEHKNASSARQNLFDARPVSSRTISAGISYQF